MRHLETIAILAFATVLTGCDGESSGSSEGTGSAEGLNDPTDLASTPVSARSTFEDGTADGWTITNVETANVSSDGTCGLVQVDPISNFLCADALEESGTSYYVAPSKFFGDLNVFSRLNFRLIAGGGSYYDSGFGFVGDISISNGVSTATHTFSDEQSPSGNWRDYRILLTDIESWSVDDGAPLPTVLQSVTDLRIRAEYGIGPDNSGLDDVFFD